MFSDVRLCGFITKSTQMLLDLQERLQFNNLMVTRLLGDDFVVVNAVDRTGYTKVGAWTKWDDSLCSRMVAGEAPDIAPHCSQVAAFQDIISERKETIGAYFGAPINDRTGRLLGTLCGTHDEAVPVSVTDHRVAIISAAQELASLYAIEIERQKDVRRLLVSTVSRTSKTRGLLDSAAWTIVTRVEEARHKVLRHPVAFGTLRVCKCQSELALNQLTRALAPTDALTAFGHGQFLFMLSDVDDTALSQQEQRLALALANDGTGVELRLVMHRTVDSFASTIAIATQSTRQPQCRTCAA